MIETLLIVHTETALNMICSLDDTFQRSDDLVWCEHLDRPVMIVGHRTNLESDMLTLL